jgi:spoIIIJ-associated protein
MTGVKKTASCVSIAVKEFMDENSVELNSVSVNILQEKIFTDKKEYTVELFTRQKPPARTSTGIDPSDVDSAVSILENLLKHTGFYSFRLETRQENGAVTIKIIAPGKDGLIIGKNGLNLLSLQYLISIIMERKTRRSLPIIIDVDTYRSKRNEHLALTAKEMCTRARTTGGEIILELMPSYERKIVHEECMHNGIKSFSIGRGPYKKVVITPMI